MIDELQPRPGIDYLDPVHYIEQYQQRSIYEIRTIVARHFLRDHYDAYDKVLRGRVLEMTFQTGRYLEDTQVPIDNPNEAFTSRIAHLNIPAKDVPFFRWTWHTGRIGVDQVLEYIKIAHLPDELVKGRLLTLKHLVALSQIDPALQLCAAQMCVRYHEEKDLKLLRKALKFGHKRLRTLGVKEAAKFIREVMEGLQSLPEPKTKTKTRTKRPGELTPNQWLDRLDKKINPVEDDVDQLVLQLKAGKKPKAKKLKAVMERLWRLHRKVEMLGVQQERDPPREEGAEERDDSALEEGFSAAAEKTSKGFSAQAENGHSAAAEGTSEGFSARAERTSEDPSARPEEGFSARAERTSEDPSARPEEGFSARAENEGDDEDENEGGEDEGGEDDDGGDDGEGDDDTGFGGDSGSGGDLGSDADSGSDGDEDEGDEDESDEDESDEDDDGPPAAHKPARTSPFERLVAIPYPTDDINATDGERAACCLLIALYRAHLLSQEVLFNLTQGNDQVSGALMINARNKIGEFNLAYGPLRLRIKELAGLGLPEMQQIIRDNPGVELQDLLPVPMHIDAQFPPMLYMSVEVIDPTNSINPSGLDKTLWFILGLIDAANGYLALLKERLDAGDMMSGTLMFQLKEVLSDAYTSFLSLHTTFRRGAELAEAEAAREEARRQERLEQQRLADAHMVVAGTLEIPPQLVKLARTLDGYHLALTLNSGLIIIALGSQGYGKSHLGICIAEGVLLDLPGINVLHRFGNVVILAADWRKGEARHQHLCGLFPNPNPSDWQKLDEMFAITFGRNNAAYIRAILLVLPGTRAIYEKRYADLMERGLEIREARLHPSEWTHSSYSLFLNSTAQLGQRKAQYQSFLDNTLAQGGDRMSPRQLLRAFDASGLGGSAKGAVRSSLQMMDSMTSEHEYLREVVEEPGVPVFAVFESTTAGKQLILAQEMAMINALSRPLPGDPYIWFIVEEGGKHMKDPEVAQSMEEATKEVRHGRRSFFLGGHLVTDFPETVVALSSGIFQFNGTTVKGHRTLQELAMMFRNVTARRVGELQRGQAFGGFRQASNGLYMREAQLYDIRPSCVWAGGETLTVVGPGSDDVDDQDDEGDEGDEYEGDE